MRDLAGLPALTRYYQRIDTGSLTDWIASLDANARRIAERGIAKARRNTSDRALKKLTVADRDGTLRIVDQPPLVQHLAEYDAERARPLAEAYLSSV